MHPKVRHIAVAALALVIVGAQAPAVAAEIEDHPLVSRYPESIPTRRDEEEFALFKLITGIVPDSLDFESIDLEGRMTRIWDEECRQAILKDALAKLRATTRTDPKTIEAFVRHVIDRQPPETVARELGMSVQAIYLAKHRCLARLRSIVEELEGAYEVN